MAKPRYMSIQDIITFASSKTLARKNDITESYSHLIAIRSVDRTSTAWANEHRQLAQTENGGEYKLWRVDGDLPGGHSHAPSASSFAKNGHRAIRAECNES